MKLAAQSIELLGRVGIPEPEKRIDAYSFQLSGGMRQRALIAMAISCNPELLFADEPTTALDVSVQAQILKLLKDLIAKSGMSMIFITHDLAVVAQMVDRVCVMYLGQIVEDAPVKEIFLQPRHPYTRKLMASILDPGDRRSDGLVNTIKGAVPEPINLPDRCPFYERCEERIDRYLPAMKVTPELIDIGDRHKVRCFREQPPVQQQTGIGGDSMNANQTVRNALVKVENLKKYFPVRQGMFSRDTSYLKAVDDVSFEIYPGETLGMVGESGCGKSTIGKAILRAYDITDGKVVYNFDGQRAGCQPGFEQPTAQPGIPQTHPDDLSGPQFITRSRV